MPKNQRLLDILGGGGLAFLLILVFVLDQVLTPETNESKGDDSKVQLAQKRDGSGQSLIPETVKQEDGRDPLQQPEQVDNEKNEGPEVIRGGEDPKPGETGNNDPGPINNPDKGGTDPGPNNGPASGNLIVTQIEAIGTVERLEKLKVVRLSAKARFAKASNVNEITLTWCWEPEIVIRFQEKYPEAFVRTVGSNLSSGNAARDRVLQRIKTRLDFSSDPTLERQFNRVFHSVVDAKKYRVLFDAPVLVEGTKASMILDQLAVPLQPSQSAAIRNLCFALSISNLIPVQRHNFEIEKAQSTMVRGRMCDQFRVKDTNRLQLQFYFDQETKLLAKISHKGHDPRPGANANAEAFWEHYFSNYRKVDDIQQWRRLEAHIDGELFSTLDVTDVKFFDEIQPELRRPGGAKK